MFAFSGKMKKRSPDKYTRRESMIAQYSRKKLEKASSKIRSSQDNTSFKFDRKQSVNSKMFNRINKSIDTH